MKKGIYIKSFIDCCGKEHVLNEDELLLKNKTELITLILEMSEELISLKKRNDMWRQQSVEDMYALADLSYKKALIGSR